MPPTPSYAITTALERDAATPPATRAAQPPLVPRDLPPGVAMIERPDGTVTIGYPITHTPPTPATPPASQPIPRWAKTTALLVPTVGGGIAVAGVGLSYAAPGLIAMADALWAAVAVIAVGGLATATLLRSCRRQPTPHTTQHITARGPFARASGTINQ